jgi:hypothetical protein
MSQSDHCRDRARHCMTLLAERNTHSEDPAAWLGLARSWLGMIQTGHEEASDGVGIAQTNGR